MGHTAADRFRHVKNIKSLKLQKYLKLKFINRPLIVFIQHPVSNFLKETKKHIRESFKALDELNLPTIVIRSNSDPGTIIIKNEFKNFKFKKNNYIRFFENLPEEIFVNVIKKSALLIGNSSMGVLEAPILGKRVVNIGLRQVGRQNANNIIFEKNKKKDIINATNKVLKLKNVKKFNKIYSSPGASKKIIKNLEKIKINEKLLNKKIRY